jgi:DNA modification methylase
MLTTTILHGDCRDILPTLAAERFDCCVTSPPYWGLRDYGVSGQIGLEPTMAAYLETMVGVCREMRRVLKPSGTFWLNIGDSYNAHPGQRKTTDKVGPKQLTNGGSNSAPSRHTPDLKPKDLCMIPNRLAIALQDDGWWVRSEIIWAKPNPMPESVTDRPTSSHEKIWLLTKGERYFYDAAAIAEPVAVSSIDRLSQNIEAQAGSTRANGGAKTNGPMRAVINEGARKALRSITETRHRSSIPGGQSLQAEPTAFRNARNVWTVATQPFRGSHFATMPADLAERCIKAGCPAGGSVLDPFGGAGTTGLVADRLGRNATLIELNPEYADMAKRRIESDAGLFADTTTDSGNG